MSEMVELPDGSGFFTASFPLPKDHWIYQRDAEGFIGEPPSGNERDAIRWAIKASTACGSEMDFDPDAMVMNILHALSVMHSSAEQTDQHAPG